MSNLPAWNGADGVYSRVYRTLERMAKAGHVSPAKRSKSGHSFIPGYVSSDMERLVTALGNGDEEEIKGLLLMVHVYPFGGER